jgi:alpha-beta hydrolase superfamily lysophospholipase
VVEKSFNQSSSTLPSSYPTLIVHGGFDSTLKELYSSVSAHTLERGYSCLTFEGLEQGRVIRKQKIPFRSDCEKVVSSVIEYIINRKEKFGIDAKRIALMGISMGGYLNARGAAFDHRLSVSMLYNGVYDGYDAIASNFPKPLLTAIEEGNSEVVNSTITILESDPNIRFYVKFGMWITGTHSP